MHSAPLEAKQLYLPPARLCGLGFHAERTARKDSAIKKREGNLVAQEGTWEEETLVLAG